MQCDGSARGQSQCLVYRSANHSLSESSNCWRCYSDCLVSLTETAALVGGVLVTVGQSQWNWTAPRTSALSSRLTPQAPQLSFDWSPCVVRHVVDWSICVERGTVHWSVTRVYVVRLSSDVHVLALIARRPIHASTFRNTHRRGRDAVTCSASIVSVDLSPQTHSRIR